MEPPCAFEIYAGDLIDNPRRFEMHIRLKIRYRPREIVAPDAVYLPAEMPRRDQHVLAPDYLRSGALLIAYRNLAGIKNENFRVERGRLVIPSAVPP